MDNVNSYIRFNRMRIVVEGPDGSGKTTVVNALYSLFHSQFPYKVGMFRNPYSDELYAQIHAKVLTPFQIAMSTLSETKIPKYPIIIQDRWSVISSQAYNYPYMNKDERFIYDAAVKSVLKKNINTFVFVMEHQHVDADMPVNNKSAVKEAYGKMIEMGYDNFGIPIIPVNNNAHPNDVAVFIATCINRILKGKVNDTGNS